MLIVKYSLSLQLSLRT